METIQTKENNIKQQMIETHPFLCNAAEQVGDAVIIQATLECMHLLAGAQMSVYCAHALGKARDAHALGKARDEITSGGIQVTEVTR